MNMSQINPQLNSPNIGKYVQRDAYFAFTVKTEPKPSPEELKIILPIQIQQLEALKNKKGLNSHESWVKQEQIIKDISEKKNNLSKILIIEGYASEFTKQFLDSEFKFSDLEAYLHMIKAYNSLRKISGDLGTERLIKAKSQRMVALSRAALQFPPQSGDPEALEYSILQPESIKGLKRAIIKQQPRAAKVWYDTYVNTHKNDLGDYERFVNIIKIKLLSCIGSECSTQFFPEHLVNYVNDDILPFVKSGLSNKKNDDYYCGAINQGWISKCFEQIDTNTDKSRNICTTILQSAQEYLPPLERGEILPDDI